MFTSKEQFLEELHSHNKFSMKLGLERVQKACEYLGDIQKSFKTIHVAGTNGKGSTCNDLAHLLQESGYRVGLYISPFIITFNERIQINGEYISDEDLIKTANSLYPIIQRVEEELNDRMTEFEIITLLSFVYFANQKVDYSVYEVGLGGRYDATNVILPEVAGITNISFDHMGVLGDTIAKIAYEKVGIAKQGLTLYTTEEKQEALDVFKHVQNEVSYSLIPLVTKELVRDVKQTHEGVEFIYQPLSLKLQLPLLGLHQVNNAVLALNLYLELMRKNNREINAEIIQSAFLKSAWAGRLEIISMDPFIIVDGSHNEDGVLKLTEAMQYYRNEGYKIRTIFTALHDKDTTKMIQLLDSISDAISFTTFNFYRSSTAEALAEKSHHVNVSTYQDFVKAIEENKALLLEKEILLITGSLYFISEVKRYFRENL